MANPYAPPGERPAPDGPTPASGSQTPTSDVRVPERGGPASEKQSPTSGTRPPTSDGKPLPAPRPDPDPAQSRQAARWLGRFALLVFASLVASGLPLPWQAGALAFSLPALVVGALALRAIIRARMRRLPAVMLGAGLTMTAFMVLGQIGLLVLWPVQQDLQECRSRALTLSAAEQCQRDFDERVTDLTRLPSRSS